MKRLIIVSDLIRDLVEIPEHTSVPVAISPDLTETLADNLTDDEDDPLFTVIFLQKSEYDKLNDYLNLVTYSTIYYQLVIFGDTSDLEKGNLTRFYHISDFRTSGINRFEFSFIVDKSFSVLDEFYGNEKVKKRYMSRLQDAQQDQSDLIDIGKSLSLEKDPDKLLRLILFLSKRITGADAGSIYLVEHDENGRKRLRFKYSHTFSADIPLEEFVMNLDKKSIAGYVAVTGEVLNIPDAYQISDMVPYSFNSYFDRKNKYITRSILAVPMKNHADEIIGVIQLLNSKENPDKKSPSGNEAFEIELKSVNDFDRFVVTFDPKYDGLLEAIAGQAAISIENNRMLQQIQHQFEEFVRASVTAIESRDPATSGHSFRVAEICTAMAKSINDIDKGYLGNVNFSESEIQELEFAALLHDFGKVYIDLSIFKKAKKLYPKDLENLLMRIEYLYRFVELHYSNLEIEMIRQSGKSDDVQSSLDDLARERDETLENIKAVKDRLIQLNEPTVMDGDPGEVIHEISRKLERMGCIRTDGEKLYVINDTDRLNLAIKRGSLNPEERKEIESHVVHTYNFVSRIPWPPEYRNIPEIALRHHEKINGSGYPDRLKGRESTSIQSRIMAIADVYDALAASDRPYKKAVPLEKVLSILKEEAEREVLDPDLVTLFIDNKIYETVDPDSFKAVNSREEAYDTAQ